LLRWRGLLGIVLVAALAGLCWLDYSASPPGTWLFPLAVLAALLGAGEMVHLASAREPRPRAGVIYVGALAPVVLCGAPMFLLDDPAHCALGWLGWPLLGVAVGVLAAFLAEMRDYHGPGLVMERLAKSLLPTVYVGLLLSFAVQLRALGAGPVGLIALISMIVVVKLSDIGAYTVGRLIGKHKLAPKLSPGKTWEGVAGGLAFALAGAYGIFHGALPNAGWPSAADAPDWGWIVYALLVAIAGLLGDLAESLLKRDAGVKDSSTWLPGFGGVLDLLDSILAAAPVAYVCWVAGLVGL
jgi:phosphatidate cytidylyltransferase